MNQSRPLWVYHALAIATVLMWSFSYIHIIWLAEFTNAFQIVIVRNYFAAPVIAVLWIWRRPRLRGLSAKQWALIIAIGLASGPAYHLPLAWGGDENRANASMIGLIIATVPIHVGWLGWLFLRERLTWRRVAGLLLGLGGVAVVLYGRAWLGGDEAGPALEFGRIEGVLAVTLAAMIAGCNTVMTRGARGALSFGPLDLLCVAGTIALLICLIATPFFHMEDLAAMDFRAWWSAFYLGFFGIGVAYITWFSALQGRLQAVSVAMYLFVPCLLSALWAWLWQDNRIGPPFFLGAAMVLGGLLMSMLKKRDAGNAA